MFKLSNKSIEKLKGVDERLVKVVMRAIELTKIDFGVVCGLRTEKEQAELVKAGASKTMKSKHIDGTAVDLMAYIGNRASWEIKVYDDIADAMAYAGKELGVGIVWGAAWAVPDITKFDGPMQDAIDSYIRLRISQNKRPFIDGPHFELA